MKTYNKNKDDLKLSIINKDGFMSNKNLCYDICLNSCTKKSKIKDRAGSIHYYCEGYSKQEEPKNQEHKYLISLFDNQYVCKDNKYFQMPSNCPFFLEQILKRNNTDTKKE